MADEENQGGSSSGNGTNKLLLGVLVLNIVVVIGVGLIVFLDQKKKDAAESIEKLAEGAVHSGGQGGADGAQAGADDAASSTKSDVRFFNVGEFTANLNGGPGAAHYIRVNVNLQLDEGLQDEEMKKRSPQIRDKVITLLNSKRPKDLQSRDGRKFLKEEIKTSINAFLETGKIMGVFFSTFVFE